MTRPLPDPTARAKSDGVQLGQTYTGSPRGMVYLRAPAQKIDVSDWILRDSRGNLTVCPRASFAFLYADGPITA